MPSLIYVCRPRFIFGERPQAAAASTQPTSFQLA
jgi:hypothetical protein